MAMTFSFKAFFDGIGRTYVHMVSAVVMNVDQRRALHRVHFRALGRAAHGHRGRGAGGVRLDLGRPRDHDRLGRARALPAPARSRSQLEAFVAALTSDILRSEHPERGRDHRRDERVRAVFADRQLARQPEQGAGRPRAARAASAEAVNSAATTVIVGILKLTFTACLAFGTSTATLVSQSLGEGNPDKAARFGWVSVRLGLVDLRRGRASRRRASSRARSCRS